MIDIKSGINLMLLPLDKIISSKDIEGNIEEEEESNEFISNESNNREGR